ncbi:MAG: hypothetical protein ACLFVP_05480 [Candidatus Bathyarchaeia archaeon]
MDDQFIRRMLPKVVKAALWGFLMGGEALLLYYLSGFKEMGILLPFEPGYFPGVMVLFIFLEVCMQLLSDTIYQHALGAARAIGTMIIMIHLSSGGVLTREIAMDAGILEVTLGFQPILAMLLTLLLLVAFKNILKAIDYLYQRSETPVKP